MLRASTIVIGSLPHETAAILAQVLPALLVAGLLGPLLSGTKLDLGSRRYFASEIAITVVAEAICLVSVISKEPISTPGTFVVLLATFYSLLGIVTYPIIWAQPTKEERESADAVKALRVAKAGVRAERRAARKRHKEQESERLKHPVQGGGTDADHAGDVSPGVVS